MQTRKEVASRSNSNVGLSPEPDIASWKSKNQRDTAACRFSLTEVPAMNHNLRSTGSFVSQLLRYPDERISAREFVDPIVSAGPVSPATFSPAERFNFLYSLDDDFTVPLGRRTKIHRWVSDVMLFRAFGK
ncbi:hypothetical protein QLX08_003914 [Tetragonisca angustula]|uniref:Uncharacterized protein n=1 Tax=Tetragonisca angustula TaxID=166442 RepID=A0AAW1A541_9HYME